MEFRFDLDHILLDDISCIDNCLINKRWVSTTKFRDEHQKLYELINIIGEASSFSQGLNNVITTAEKLQNSEHFLYLMKEKDPKLGCSVLVGMLKVGHKRLFLLNEKQETKEVTPLCVLDFYIHESRQRRGYGRRLFDYMLKHQQVEPGHMAVDKPSDKFMFFLKKHYGLHKQVPQINNFVVFKEFFGDTGDSPEDMISTPVRQSRNTTPESEPSRNSSRRSSANYTHFAGKPSRCENTSMADILHGRGDRCPSAVKNSQRYQTTLDWMRGGSSFDPDYSYSRGSYSASRTPSNVGSPLRTPHGASPPPTPKNAAQELGAVKGNIIGSAGQTPPSSPHKEVFVVDAVENGHDAVDGEFEDETQEKEVLSQTELAPQGDIVPDDVPSLGQVQASCGHRSAGVLKDDDSVHGHLKFHHHALW